MKKKTKFDEFDNITVWGLPGEILQSQYGSITYEDWCKKEAARFRASGKLAAVCEIDGLVSVIRPASASKNDPQCQEKHS